MLEALLHNSESPGHNLAFDDSLLESRRPVLRLWESAVHFVVSGRSVKLQEEVDLAACAAHDVPVLRRSSGGGTVLQGPGCLNFSVVLPLDGRPELLNVQESYRVILAAIAEALSVPGVQACGSDILLNGRKFSGSAQRRSSGWLLHHGTLAYALDFDLLERLLPEPRRKPPHRNGRTHREFLTTLPLTADAIIQRISSAFSPPA